MQPMKKCALHTCPCDLELTVNIFFELTDMYSLIKTIQVTTTNDITSWSFVIHNYSLKLQQNTVCKAMECVGEVKSVSFLFLKDKKHGSGDGSQDLGQPSAGMLTTT